MAVEIPVVVDIEGGFKDAAKRTPQAAQPLEAQMEQVGRKMSKALAAPLAEGVEMTTARITNSIKKAQLYASKPLGTYKDVRGVEELNAKISKYLSTTKNAAKTMLDLGKAQGRLVAGRHDIRALASEITVLASKWNSMKLGSKFDADGKLRVRSQEVLDKMSRLTAQVVRFGDALAISGTKGSAGMNRAAKSINATNIALERQSTIIGRLKSYLSGYMLLFAGFRFVKNIRETTAELELQKVALSSILRDADFASDLFRQIKASALKSPFEIKDLITFTKQLAAYRIENEKLFDVTQRLADVSAGLGVDMNRLVLAYGQVRAASVLRGQELRQFTEAGIPLVELLAEKFRELGREGTTTADVFELISKRAVPFRMIEDIFNDMTSAGGTFYKMQEKQSETLKGQWMKLKDAITIMYDEMGNTEVVHNAMTGLINSLLSLTRAWRETGRWIKTIVGMIIAYKAVARSAVLATNSITKAEALRLAAMKRSTVAMPKFIAAIIGETKAKQLNRLATRGLAIAQYNLATSTTVLGRAFWKLNAAMMSNPYGLIAAAIAGVALGVYTLIKNTHQAAITIDELEQSLSKFQNALSKQSDTDTLIAAYEELQSKTERTVEETEKLIRVSKELARAFPSTVEGIDEESGALKVNIERVKELTQAERDLELARLKRDARRARKRITELEAKQADILDRKSQLRSGAKTEARLAKLGEKYNKLATELEPLRNTLQSINELLDEINGVPGSSKGGGARSGSGEMFKGWKAALSDLQKQMMESGKLITPEFDDDSITKMEDVYDLYKKTKKAIDETSKSLDGLKGVQADLDRQILKASKEGNKELLENLRATSEANNADIERVQGILDFYNAVKAMFGFTFKNDRTSYQKDSFITIMENRIKFMKDFKKGYDDLSKYMTKQGALSQEGGIMLGRGLSLDLNADEQKRAAEDLSNWYQDQINAVIAEMKRKGVKGETLTEILSQKIKGDSNKAKMLRDYQALLQSLWDAKTDFDTSEFVKKMEKALKRSEERLKASETARNFFNNILDVTGDEELAHNLTVSVYGTVGSDFKDRLRSELLDALNLEGVTVPSELKDKLTGDIMLLDVDAIRAEMDKLPPEIKELFEKALDADQKFNADWLLNFEKTYAKAKTYKQRVDQLTMQKENAVKEAKAMGKTADEIAAVEEKWDRDIANVQLEALKDTYTWTKAFEDLDGVSGATLDNLIKLIDEYITKYGHSLEPTQLKDLTRAKERAKAQKLERNSIKGVISAVKRLNAARGKQISLSVAGRTNEEAFIKAQDDEADAADDLAKSIQEVVSQMQELVSTTQDLLEVFASSEDAQYFTEQLNNVSKGLGGVGKIAVGIAEFETNPIQALLHILTGVEEVVASVFSTSYAAKVKRANDEIERQADLIEALERSYKELDEIMDESFGTDYIQNYRTQLAMLNAEVEAYRAQAAAERSKGKKADEDKALEYERNAEEALKRAAEATKTMQETFAGSSLASAAESFTDAWLSAYREFGDTAGAIEERMEDMVNNLVEKAALSGIVQAIMGGWYQSLSEIKDWNAQSIAEKVREARDLIPIINQGLGIAASELEAAGIDLRGTVGQFTGIKRDIANATEESITGLAAGINTQNFYMQHIDMNVAAILSALTGGTTATGASVTGEYVDPYKDTMLSYVGSLPQMRDDMASIRAMLEKVIRPNGAPAQHYVAVKM